MNICHISTVHPSNDIRIFVKQCSTLVSKDRFITLVINNASNEFKNGVRIKALKERPSAFKRILFNHPIILKFTILKKFDIIHAHDPELLPLLYFLNLLGKNVVYDMHENFPKQLNSKKIPKLFKKALGFIWPKVENKILKNINVIFAEKSYKKDYSFVKNHVDILNMPLVNQLRKINTNKHKRFTIGYVGDVSEDRGCIKTLEAIHILQSKGLNIGFECVGEILNDLERNKIDKLISKLENINFYGRLPPSVAWEKISKCHIGMALLMPKSNYIESYPTKLFEYLIMEIPILTSNFPLYKRLIKNNKFGICVNPNDSIEISNAILELYYNKSLYKKIMNNLKTEVKMEYDWKFELEKLVKFYNYILR